MKITEQTPTTLVVSEPSTNRFISWILLTIGGLASLAILASAESFLPNAIMPLLIVAAGLYMLLNMSLPRLLILDKNTQRIIHKVPAAWTKQYGSREYTFDEVEGFEVGERSFTNSGTGYSIVMKVANEDEPVPLFPYRRGEKKTARLVEAVDRFYQGYS